MHICSFIYDEEPKRIHSTDALVRCEDPFTFLRKQTYPNSVCLFTGHLSLTLFVSREKKKKGGECCVLIFVLCIVVSKVLNSLNLMPLNLLYELVLMLTLWILWFLSESLLMILKIPCLCLANLIISILQQAFWLISPAIGGSWNLSE